MDYWSTDYIIMAIWTRLSDPGGAQVRNRFVTVTYFRFGPVAIEFCLNSRDHCNDKLAIIRKIEI